jgi:hypothetical protein
MPQIVGTVQCVQVADDIAFVTIDPPTGQSETLILWAFPGTGGGIPEEMTAYTRIMHSMWVSLLREAHANNLTATVVHRDATVTSVRLGVF